MSAQTTNARFQLYYWPIPFRGCFISYLFAYRNIPLLEERGLDQNAALRELHPSEQPVPHVGPPLLHDLESDRFLSQMPAIVAYVSPELDLMPAEPFEQAICMKVLMDCNDVLMEICRYNGSTMWERGDWREFRSRRLPRWMQVFEESMKRGCVGSEAVTFADIAIFSLFGNMMRCLPELETELIEHAPGIRELCRSIGSEPSLAHYVAAEEESYGKLYCGGQIEASIREMLKMDAEQAGAGR